MSAKFVYNLSDETPDLRKQIGCMNGILQFFDRHHFLGGGGGGRRVVGHNQKRLPSSGKSSNHEVELKSAARRTPEKTRKKSAAEKHRNSTESSRTSFSSSSCSSSLASLECNRTLQPEPSSSGQSSVPENHAGDSPMNQLQGSLQSIRQSFDLRDIVKDSIYREPRGLSVKTKGRGESGGQTLKYIDSPRPLQHPKSEKASGIKDSFRILQKHREVPCKSGEGKHDSLTHAMKDSPRFSCDGRESRASLRSTTKLKESPRLSLDSRAGSMRGLASEMKSNDPLPDSVTRNDSSNIFLNQQEEPGSYRRPSSVVAKLMGLESLPDAMSPNENQTGQIKTQLHEEIDPFGGSSRTADATKLTQFYGSPRNQQNKEPISPRPTNADLMRKATACSKFPMEPAPWRQIEVSRSSQTQAPKSRVTQTKTLSSSLSVYGEIEKRLAQLEFERSGKDLRALKQILEGMQKTKEVLNTRNEVQNYVSWTNSDRNLGQNTKSAGLQNTNNNSAISAPDGVTSSPKSFKSPIVIMKPAKLIGKACNSPPSVKTSDGFLSVNRLRTNVSGDCAKESFDKRTAKDNTPRLNHLREPSSQSLLPTNKNTETTSTRLATTSKKSKPATKESFSSCRSAGSTIQRQQQKRLGMDKQPPPATPSSESNRSRRQTSQQVSNSGSPRGKLRAKSPKLHPCDDECSDMSTELRDLSHHGDSISLQSESNISLVTQIEDEVSSTDISNKISRSFTQNPDWKQKNPVDVSAKEKSAAEQPSPMSVLDANFYGDELPSPIKKISIAFKDEEVIASDELERNPLTANQSSSSSNSCLYSLTDQEEVMNMKLAIQNVTQLLTTHEEAITNGTATPYNSTNPDHRYISEILFVSGFLKDFDFNSTTIHPHHTAYPIDPSLFLALEQSKASAGHLDDVHNGAEPHDKSRRKLIFDFVNEILVHKLPSEISAKQGLLPTILAGKRPRGSQLLGELCLEIDRRQSNNTNCSLDDEYDSLGSIIWADITHDSPCWEACNCEIPGLVLAVERYIFKDLITEIVNGEANPLPRRPAGYCRQLFST